MLNFHPATENQQEKLGASLSACCPADTVIFLQGDLGVGKTTLVRGFLRGAGHHGKVKSPTYTLIEPYEFPGRVIYHLDLYRLGDPEELEYLGIRDLMREQASLLIEWPERGVGMLPTPDIWLRIEYADTGRRVKLTAASESGGEILALLSKPRAESLSPF